jgi:4-hydroxy-tetrahydrodipicolinate synthase
MRKGLIVERQFIIRGNVPAPVTPFDDRGQVRYDDYEEMVRWLIARGADGICVAGDNGESWTLSPEERQRLCEAAVRAAAGRVPVIAGASATTAVQSIKYAEAVASTGIAALMIGPQPYVMKATTSEIVTRLTTIHRAVPLPVVLYNSPRRSNISLTLADMKAITEAIDVRGLKEASRDFFYLSEVIRHFGKQLAVMVGPAPYIIPGIYLGAAGFISSGPELLGERTRNVMSAATKAPTAEIRELQHAFTRIYETLMSLGTWPSALKAALQLVGQPAGLPREPVAPLGREDRDRLAAVMRELGIAAASAVAA